MKSGKIAENILKRSVTNLIGKGPVAGKDCAVTKTEDGYVLTAEALGSFESELSVKCAVYRAANNIWAGGGRLLGINAVFMLDRHMEERDLKRLTRTVIAACTDCGTILLGGHTEGIPDIEHSYVAVTAIGSTKEPCQVKGAKPGDDIVISKWAALEKTALVVNDENSRQSLLTRFSEGYIEPVMDFSGWLTVREEAEIAYNAGVRCMHDLSLDGIYGALWDVSEGCGHGFAVELDRIPFKQETVEIANFFEYNAYMAESAGSLMMVTPDGEKLVGTLNDAGIPAVIIGRISDDNDKKILNEDEIRYLGRK